MFCGVGFYPLLLIWKPSDACDSVLVAVVMWLLSNIRAGLDLAIGRDCRDRHYTSFPRTILGGLQSSFGAKNLIATDMDIKSSDKRRVMSCACVDTSTHHYFSYVKSGLLDGW
jgi:hypothetical protein